MYGVSEYELKRTHLNYLKKEKENRFDEPKRRDDTVQNENENLIETYRRQKNSYPVDPSGKRYNHSKAEKEGDPWKRYSEKCPLDLKTVHKYIPEKQSRQELYKIICSTTAGKKSQVKIRHYGFDKSYENQQQKEDVEQTKGAHKWKKARENIKEEQ